VGIEYTEAADTPDEPRLPRPPDKAPSPLSDSADREAACRSYKEIVDAANADLPHGTSDITDTSTNGKHGPGRELPLLRAATGEGHQDNEPAKVEPEGRGHRESKGGADSEYCDVSELKGGEPGTADRLMDAREFTGGSLRGFRHPTGNPDYIDEYNRTYDQIGGPEAWNEPSLKMDEMIHQIKRHVYEKVGHDFTALDLTGASSDQIDEVFENLDKWEADPAMRPRNRLIIVGDDF
jgi:hypothetical protein